MATQPDEPRRGVPRKVMLTRDRGWVRPSPVEIVSYALAGLAMWLTLALKLLSCLLAGLLIYQMIHSLAPLLARRLSGQRARWIAVVALSVIIIGALTGMIVGSVNHFREDALRLQTLLDQVMEYLDQARGRLPGWIARSLPVDSEEMKQKASAMFHAHASTLTQGGKDAARVLTHVLIGMILGAIIAVSETQRAHRPPLTAALVDRATRFSEAFRRIVFAQIKISAINAVFTGMFLLIGLPLFHLQLPLAKTLVMVAFVVGLLPVIGNLISNALILMVSMSVGAPAAIASFVFLVLIHKLEYFLNARIVGGEIEARAWELLVAMLVMEAAFGLVGVIAAPIFYAYVKRELIMSRLI